MKITKTLSFAAISALMLFAFIKCKKDDTTTDKNITYITSFYGANTPRTFVFQNPDDTKLSRKVTLQWNDSGKVSITNVTIARDSANEQRQVAYLPMSELDTAGMQIRPTNTVVKTLVYDVTSQEYLNCTGGYWYCGSVCGGPLTYGPYTLGTGSYVGVHCGNNPPSSVCGPFWRCTGGSTCGKCNVLIIQSM